jgi:hypothetical protein
MPNALTLDSMSPKLLTVARERHQALVWAFLFPVRGLFKPGGVHP